MIEAVIKKLLLILNKPIHYLFVGIFLLLCGRYYNISNYVIIGGCLFFFAIASFTDLIYKFFCKKFQSHSRKEKINKVREKYEKDVIAEYQTLSSYEKHFIRSIVLNNIPVKYISNIETPAELNRIYSIEHRGWGSYNKDNNLFMFNNKILKILQKHFEEEKKNQTTSGTITRIRVCNANKELNNAE